MNRTGDNKILVLFIIKEESRVYESRKRVCYFNTLPYQYQELLKQIENK